MSEIDDIFASKTKSKQKQKPSTPSLPQPKSRIVGQSPSKKRTFPETVVDISADLPAGPSKRRKKESIPDKNCKPKKSKKRHDKATDFEDSRGSSDRRKTEEGWSVYKEHELGLNSEGGDTPLCPFDCNCCF